MSTYREIFDQHGGIIRRVEYKPQYEQDGILWSAEQDVDNIIAANKRDEDVDQRKRTFRLAARVPLEVWNRAAREGWLNDQAAWKRYLNDPDNRAFRVWQGQI